MFSGEAEDKPKWADDILGELREIKILLQEQKKASKQATKSNSSLSNFINEFRVSMKTDTINNIEPTFIYQDKKLGINKRGLLYDKNSMRILPRAEAFKVYKYAHNHQENIVLSA